MSIVIQYYLPTYSSTLQGDGPLHLSPLRACNIFYTSLTLLISQ